MGTDEVTDSDLTLGEVLAEMQHQMTWPLNENGHCVEGCPRCALEASLRGLEERPLYAFLHDPLYAEDPGCYRRAIRAETGSDR